MEKFYTSTSKKNYFNSPSQKAIQFVINYSKSYQVKHSEKTGNFLEFFKN